MKEDIENTSDSSKETRSVFIGAKVTPTQKEHIKSLAGQCSMTVSDYILSRAYNFKPKARLTKEEAALLQNLDDCRSDLIKYTSALHGMSTKQRMTMFNQIPFMMGWLKELGNVAENICQFLNAVKEKKKIEDELEVYSAAAVADVTPVSDVIIYPNKKGLEKEMGFSVGEFTHFDCGDIKYETYAGVVAILQEEAVLNNWMRVTFYKTRESYDIINRYLIKARSYVYNNENVSKNLNEEINGVDVLIRGGDKKKEDDYVMSASWTANGFNYVVYAEKYVHMDELKQLVVDVMESEEYKAGK